MSKLLAYTIGGQKIGIDILTWDEAMLSGNTAFIVIADTGSTPSNYTNISSVDNWDRFGNSSTFTMAQVKNEIIKLIPNTPTQAQYLILEKYMNIGINAMTKIGTTAMLGSTLTSTTSLTGITDTKMATTGSTSANLKVNSISGQTGTYWGDLRIEGKLWVEIIRRVKQEANLSIIRTNTTTALLGTAIGGLQIQGVKTSGDTYLFGVNKDGVLVAGFSGGTLYSVGYDNYLYAECTTNRTTTSTTCIKAQGLTGATVAGRYQVDFNAEVGNATAAGCTFVAFKVDNATWGCNYQYKTAATSTVQAISINMSRDITLTAATHCFDVWYWNSGGTACIPMNSIRVKRIC